jgi:hypothetical protein
MKFTHSAFHNDRLTLTTWDLIRLLFGARLKVGALEIERKP